MFHNVFYYTVFRYPPFSDASVAYDLSVVEKSVSLTRADTEHRADFGNCQNIMIFFEHCCHLLSLCDYLYVIIIRRYFALFFDRNSRGEQKNKERHSAPCFLIPPAVLQDLCISHKFIRFIQKLFYLVRGKPIVVEQVDVFRINSETARELF